ncbi:MAG: hypothetical protein K1X64_11625 [Myxococcaceae bacterium]|nr:hypothetical protein [Myxococcaceae bacterium]
MSDAFEDRRKEMEEAFFRKQNEKLLEKMRHEKQVAVDRQGIARLTGITQDAVLDTLLAMKLNPETVTAFTLFPLVEVAWADGAVDAKEKKAVLEGAAQKGIAPGSAAAELLEGWLANKPSPKLHDTWKSYVQAMCKNLEPIDRENLKKELLGWARQVAQATGGILGMGEKVSSAEETALHRLAEAFS